MTKRIAVFAVLILVSTAFGQLPVKRILLEEFSTAPCGFCPDGDLIAAQLVKDHPSIIWVTHHAGFGTDSMTVTESKAIASAFTTFAPGACIDRGDHPIPVYTIPPHIAISRQKWDSVCTAHLGDTAAVDVRVRTVYDPARRSLRCDVEAEFVIAPQPGELRVQLYVVEDSVVGYGKGFDQKNYFNTTKGHPYYGKGDSIYGYVHHRVLRAVPSGTWGLSGVIPASPTVGVTYAHTFANIPVNTWWKERDLDVVAFVSYHHTDAKQRRVLNAAQVRVLDGTVGLPEDPVDPAVASFEVFPNPASGQVQFRYAFDPARSARLTVTDVAGRVVLAATLEGGRRTIGQSVATLPRGLYLYRITGLERILTGNFVVQR
ncbi:MAG: Omp28-related outer membrane protein [Ignavibacteria bacterium]|nr:Omp28-related outer membrane protein [Ignavibacteria bacterium]